MRKENIKEINRRANAYIKDFFTINLKIKNNHIVFTIVDKDIEYYDLGIPNSLLNIRGNAKGLTPSLSHNLLNNCTTLKGLLPINFITQNNIIEFINKNNNISILLFNLDTQKNIVTENIEDFYVYTSVGVFGEKAQLYRLNDFLNNINGLTVSLNPIFFPNIKRISCKNPININESHSSNLQHMINYYLTKDRCGLVKAIRNVYYNDKVIIFEKNDNIRSTNVSDKRMLFNLDIIESIAQLEGVTPIFSFNKLVTLYNMLQSINVYTQNKETLLIEICNEILNPRIENIVNNLYGGSKMLKDYNIIQLRKLMKKYNKSCYKDGKILNKSSMIRILKKCL
jgi:hypothetical protein